MGQHQSDEEVLEPGNNKNIMIEIFDNKKNTQNKKEVSLAEMFKAR